MIGRNDPCFCGSGKKWKNCHFPKLPPSALSDKYLKQWGILLKNDKQIEGIRIASKLTAQILDELCKAAKEGVTTNELNQLAERLHRDAGAIAAPLHYGHPPFPKSICTSLNDVICHGIPDDQPLKAGDILNIDVSAILNGYYGDCSRMAMVGRVSKEAHHIVDVSKECLERAIRILMPNLQLSEIGSVIEDFAESKDCSVVYQFVGHGVGLKFHEPPQVPHHRNELKIPLAPGMIFTIEPMINLGAPEAKIDANGWTARTTDGKLSAQFEHTVLITESGYEILTLLES